MGESEMKRFQAVVTMTTEAVFTIEADTTSKNKLRIIALEKLESADSDRKLSWRTLASDMVLYEVMPNNEPIFF
jgi:hypothetical protein